MSVQRRHGSGLFTEEDVRITLLPISLSNSHRSFTLKVQRWNHTIRI